jgi:RNA polymerase II subunit A small phosphatase-like protein
MVSHTKDGKKNLLLLDLDGTLITSMSYESKNVPDFIYSYKDISSYNVFKRPCLDIFLQKCFEKYEVGIWTASEKEYAEFISKKVFGVYFEKLSFFLYGRKSLFNQVKYLNKLKQKYDLHDYNIVLLDNDSTHCNQFNSIKIKTYIPYKFDSELLDSLEKINLIFNLRL